MAEQVRYSYFYNKFDIVHRNEKATYPMPPHTHNAIEIYFNLSELPNSLLGSTLTPVSSDVLLIIPSYCIHQFTQEPDQAYERYILTINTSWLNNAFDSETEEKYAYLKDTANPLLIPLTTEKKEMLIQSFEKCINCSNDDIFLKMSCFFETLSLIHNISSDMHNTPIKHMQKHLSGTRKTVNEMIEYINEHLYDNIKIQDISDKFFLSPDYAAKIFKKYTNTPIGNYITIQRITRAKQLLREGHSVAETQLQTGYSSYEHFFRIFKKTTGMTPKEYRNAYMNER